MSGFNEGAAQSDATKRRWLRPLLGIPAALLIIAAATVISFRLGVWNSSPSDVRAKYATSHSHFITVDGTTLHYADEGQGPLIILLHGHLASLQQWDGWVDLLKDHYRIIRVDLPPFGLSTFDSTGEYGLTRTQVLVDGFINSIDVSAFYLGGTSIGAGLSVRYAASHPTKVKALLLSTLPAIYPAKRDKSLQATVVQWVSENVLETKYPKMFWSSELKHIFGDPNKVTDELVTRYDELNGQPGQAQALQLQMAANRALAKNNTLPADLQQLQMPVLLQWAGKSPVLPEKLIDDIQKLFSNAKLTLIQYPELGHKLTIEDPVKTGRDAKAFLEALEASP